MTDKPPSQDEPGTEERFDLAIKNALAMKPKPHKPKRESGSPDPRPASSVKGD